MSTWQEDLIHFHQNPTVLVVDDNPVNLSVITKYLKESGFEIFVAQNGESALKKVHYMMPDLVLLDVMMPGMDGFEVCRQLKADDDTKDIPVIFLTALAQTSDKIEGFNAGAVDYITKPLQYEEVLVRVNTHLKLQQTSKMLQRYEAYFQTWNQLTQLTTAVSTLDTFLEQAVHAIQSQLGYHFTGVWLPHEAQNTLELKAGSMAHQPHTPTATAPLTASPHYITTVYEKGRDYLSKDVQADTRYEPIEGVTDIQAAFALPLNINQGTIGVLDIQHQQRLALNLKDRAALQNLANQLAVTVYRYRF